MLKEKLPLVLINTLLLHIPLLALTHPWSDRQTNGWSNKLVLVGLGNLPGSSRLILAGLGHSNQGL
jgi:hypothetical protein